MMVVTSPGDARRPGRRSATGAAWLSRRGAAANATLGGDKELRRSRVVWPNVRELRVTPHVAQNTTTGSAIDEPDARGIPATR